MVSKQTNYRIKWNGGIYGEALESEGIYRDFESCYEDFEQCCYLQPENNYIIQRQDEEGSWGSIVFSREHECLDCDGQNECEWAVFMCGCHLFR